MNVVFKRQEQVFGNPLSVTLVLLDQGLIPGNRSMVYSGFFFGKRGNSSFSLFFFFCSRELTNKSTRR